jgi:hypothetical protein
MLPRVDYSEGRWRHLPLDEICDVIKLSNDQEDFFV